MAGMKRYLWCNAFALGPCELVHDNFGNLAHNGIKNSYDIISAA